MADDNEEPSRDAGCAPGCAPGCARRDHDRAVVHHPDPGEGDPESLLRRREQLRQADAGIDAGLHALLYDPDRDMRLRGLAGARSAPCAEAPDGSRCGTWACPLRYK